MAMTQDNEQQLLKVTILRLLPDGLSPKKMLAAVKGEHPKASKSEIIRAAFAAMIETADTDVVKSLALHSLGMDLRKTGTGEEAEATKQKKKRKASYDLRLSDELGNAIGS